MLVVSVCSTKIWDSATFSFTKKELHINVLGARSAPSVPRERNDCGIIIKQFQWSRNGVINLHS